MRVGYWLESYRRRTLPKDQRPSLFNNDGTKEALLAWYGPEEGARLVADLKRNRNELKWIGLGALALFVGIPVLLWLLGIAK
jgi:hypothetical protein